MNNNYTPRAQQVLSIARREAARFHHNYIGAEHVLLGLLKLGQGVAISVMENAGIDIAALTLKVEQSILPGSSTPEGSLPYTPRVRKILVQAGEEAQLLKHTYVGTEHLLLGIPMPPTVTLRCEMAVMYNPLCPTPGTCPHLMGENIHNPKVSAPQYIPLNGHNTPHRQYTR